jgi:hypothetical protein
MNGLTDRLVIIVILCLLLVIKQQRLSIEPILGS